MLQTVLDFIFPKTCLGCRQFGIYLCSKCAENLLQKELICPMCAKPAFAGATHPICRRPWGMDGLWTFAAYTGPTRQAIQKLKYRLVSSLVDNLTDLIVEYWAKYPPLLLDLIKFNASSVLIVPVPLHAYRQKVRGFNQAELISRSLAEKLGLEFQPALKRIRPTRPQVGLDAAARKANLKNAFAMTKNFDLKERHIILIDDVWTTGSTMRECTQILKRAGAKSVWGLTIAR